MPKHYHFKQFNAFSKTLAVLTVSFFCIFFGIYGYLSNIGLELFIYSQPQIKGIYTMAAATTYYVDGASGNDSNDGISSSTAFKTIQKAANIATAGDTVNVAAGVYNEKVTFTISGTAGNPIVFQTNPDNRAIIDGTGLNIIRYDTLVRFNGASYITFSGFEVRNSPYENILIHNNSTHLKLLYLDVHHAGTIYGVDSQIIATGCSVPAFSEIAYCEVHDGPGAGITLWSASGGYWNIHDNEVYNNEGAGNWDGIEIGGASVGTNHVIIRNNIIYNNGYNQTTGIWNNGADNLDVSSHGLSHHMLIEGNKVSTSVTGPAFKIHSGADNYIPGTSGHIIARNNVLIRSNTSAYAYPNPIVYYNNTFFNSSNNQYYPENCDGLCNVGDSTYSGGDTGRANWKNNLFFNNDSSIGGYLIHINNASAFNLTYASLRFQHNLYKFGPSQTIAWEKWRAAMTPAIFADYQSCCGPDYPDVGSIMVTTAVGDMFVNYSNEDFRLVDGSPAVDAGMPLTHATNSGSNSTQLTVDRASYFSDGYPLNGEYLDTPDSIIINDSAAVQIVSIDDSTNTIVLSEPRTWSANDPVTLPYYGSAPDVGAYESGEPSPCEEEWSCTAWSPATCPASQIQTCTCVDANYCGTTINKPAESRSCVYTCSPNWSCTAWSPSPCPSSQIQTRTCTDSNNCGTATSTSQSCVYTPPVTSCSPNWVCTGWSVCNSSGRQIRTCTDSNSCGTATGKPAESQSCTYIPPTTSGGSGGATTPVVTTTTNSDQSGAQTIRNTFFKGRYIKTATNPAVYHIGSDNKRRLFSNEVTYWTWKTGTWNTQTVETISQDEFDQINIDKNVTVRPGSRLIRFVNSSKLYAVLPDDKLCPVSGLYSAYFRNRAVLIQDAFETDYTKDSACEITNSSSYPDGSLIQYAGSDEIYYILDGHKHLVSATVFSQNGFKDENVIKNVSTSMAYPTGWEMAEW